MRAGEAIQGGAQIDHVDRFLEVANVAELFGVRREVAAARDDHHGDARQSRIAALLAAKATAVQHGHHQVQEDERGRRLAAQIIQGFLAIGHRVYGKAPRCKQPGQVYAHLRLILHDKDEPLRGRFRHGDLRLVGHDASVLRDSIQPTGNTTISDPFAQRSDRDAAAGRSTRKRVRKDF